MLNLIGAAERVLEWMESPEIAEMISEKCGQYGMNELNARMDELREAMTNTPETKTHSNGPIHIVPINALHTMEIGLEKATMSIQHLMNRKEVPGPRHLVFQLYAPDIANVNYYCPKIKRDNRHKIHPKKMQLKNFRR